MILSSIWSNSRRLLCIKDLATRASVAGVCDDTAVDYDDVRDDEEQTEEEHAAAEENYVAAAVVIIFIMLVILTIIIITITITIFVVIMTKTRGVWRWGGEVGRDMS